MHADKARMERVIEEEEDGSVLGGAVVVRPSALTDGVALGKESVRVGRKGEPAVGYTVSREDVGLWIFEEVIVGGESGWMGEKVSLTY